MNNSITKIAENLSEIETNISRKTGLVYSAYLLGITETLIESIFDELEQNDYDEYMSQCSDLYDRLVEIINGKMYS